MYPFDRISPPSSKRSWLPRCETTDLSLGRFMQPEHLLCSACSTPMSNGKTIKCERGRGKNVPIAYFAEASPQYVLPPGDLAVNVTVLGEAIF